MARLSTFVICLIGLAAWAISGNAQQSAPKRKPVAARRASMIVLEQCRIKLINFATLAADHTGILSEIGVKEGDTVRAEQLLSSLKDAVVRARLAKAEKEASNDIEVKFSKKAAEVAQVELDKAEEANKIQRRAIPEVEVKRLRLSRDKSLLQIDQAALQFEIAKLTRDEANAELQAYQIIAPFDGVVTRVFKSKGEAVRQGDPIIELSGTKRVKVEGYVDVKDIWNVKRGHRVRVRLDVEDMDLEVENELFEGQIVFVDVSAQPVTGQVRVWAEVVNRDNILRAGLNARMAIYPPGTLPEKTAGKPATRKTAARQSPH
jgi:RND family efflux transporter MFP subunit